MACFVSSYSVICVSALPLFCFFTLLLFSLFCSVRLLRSSSSLSFKIKAAHGIFPREQLLILADTDLKLEPVQTMARVFEHVGLPPFDVSGITTDAIEARSANDSESTGGVGSVGRLMRVHKLQSTRDADGSIESLEGTGSTAGIKIAVKRAEEIAESVKQDSLGCRECKDYR